MEIKVSDCLAKVDTDKIWHHNYGPAYDSILSAFDRDEKLNILEVGTQKGGSLQAWKEYFPNSNVYGVDVVDVVTDEYRKDNVTRVISDIKDWKTDVEFDIVIDDGSHYLGDTTFVVAKFIQSLKMHGCIIVEDVRCPDLFLKVVENLVLDITIPYGVDGSNIMFHIGYFDNRKKGHESSFLVYMFKNPKE